MVKKLLMGNEAFAHAALEAGVNVVAGYPGTPSSELVETVAKLHAAGAAQDVHVEWSTNEKAALEMLAGASYCGARVLFTCKQVGLNVASDALMSLNYVGTGGGCVLFVADDPGPISSQTEQDTRRFGSFAKVPVLDPATPEQGFAMMRIAFELSERYHTPVIVRPTTRINHASTFFEVAEETHGRPLPEGGFQKDPKWVIFPKRAYEGHGEINRRLAQIAWDYAHDPAFAQFNEVFEGGGEGETIGVVQNGVEGAGASAPAVGIVAGGVSAAYAREALSLIEAQASRAGVPVPRYRFMAVGTPYPFPAETAAAFAEELTDVIVFEELDSVLEEEMLKLTGERHLPLRVHGKLTGAANDRGENTTENIAGRLGRFFDRTSASADSPREGGGTSTCSSNGSLGGTAHWAVPFAAQPARERARRASAYLAVTGKSGVDAEFDGLAVLLQLLRLLAGHLCDGAVERLLGTKAGLGPELTDEHDVAEAFEASLLAHLRRGNADDRHALRLGEARHHGRVNHHNAALFHVVDELVKGGLVQGDECARARDQRAADGLIGQRHRAVGGAAAHLGAVGGHPRHLAVLDEAGRGDDLAGEQRPLAAEAGDDTGKILAH